MSRCPHCHGVMLGYSPWCLYCCREWSVRTYAEVLPDNRTARHAKYGGRGMGSRCLSQAQREAVMRQLREGKRGTQSRLAREHFVTVSTIARIAREVRRMA